MKPKDFVLKTGYEYGWPHMGSLREKLKLGEGRVGVGQIVKVTPVRAKNKRWLTRQRDILHNNYYYRVVSSNGITSVLKSTAVEDIEYEEKEMASLYVNGYKPSDLYDLDFFMAAVLPEMLDKFIKLHKEWTAEESPDFYDVLNTAEALRDFLKEEKEIEDNYIELTEEEEEARSKLCQEVWSNFGKHFHKFWV